LRKIYISLGVLIVFITHSFAEPVIPRGDFAKKLKKAAGEQGQFVVGRDDFPKSYFLVHQNLPFLAGLALHHPKSSTLNLSKEQIEAMKGIKNRTVPTVVKTAQEIKSLELQLAQNVAINSNTPQSQFEIIDKIAKLRTDLTKAHIKCINEVREVLSEEQYKKLLGYASKMAHKPKSNKFRVDELVLLPHPGKFFKKGMVDITKEQMQRIAKEVKAVYAPKFQGKLREALKLEKKLRKKVESGVAAKDVKKLIDEIARLKRESIDIRVDALNHIRSIVTQEQWKKINKLTYK
jgi:hypothetical protein